MGKNKLNTQNPGKCGNPIYKKAGTGAPQKAKNKVKPVKTNLKKLKISNKEAIASLDKKLPFFYEDLQKKEKKIATDHPAQHPKEDKPPVDMDAAAEELSKL